MGALRTAPLRPLIGWPSIPRSLSRAGTVMSPPTHMLVGIDESERSLVAWRYATALARCCRSKLTALHVAMPYWPASCFARDVWRATRAEAAARARGHTVLERARSLATGLHEAEYALVFGDPAKKICQQARDLEADLIVLASHGRNRIERLLLESVSSAPASPRSPSTLLRTVLDEFDSTAPKNKDSIGRQPSSMPTPQPIPMVAST